MDQVLSSDLKTANMDCRFCDFFLLLFLHQVSRGPSKAPLWESLFKQTNKKVSQLISCLILLADAELSLLTVLTVRVVLTAQHFPHDVHKEAETGATLVLTRF